MNKNFGGQPHFTENIINMRNLIYHKQNKDSYFIHGFINGFKRVPAQTDFFYATLIFYCFLWKGLKKKKKEQ